LVNNSFCKTIFTIDTAAGNNELVEERVKVNQQERNTPGRRGEKIKQEEIDKEIVRRDKIKNGCR
jgi:pyrrolidone-carboxylate peptidase